MGFAHAEYVRPIYAVPENMGDGWRGDKNGLMAIKETEDLG